MIIYSKDTTDGTTSATYNCNEGFSLDEGKRVITCDVDGSSWRGQPRTCSGIIGRYFLQWFMHLTISIEPDFLNNV